MTEQQSTATGVKFAPNAEVDPRATIGCGTTIWGLACIREDAVLGRDCVIGRGAYIEDGVTLGDRVKVHTNALLFKPARIGDDVFIGPAVILTNDRYPRSSTPDGELKREADWTAEGVVIDKGAAIGARSVILPGVHIGRFAMVAAGAVVTRDVSDFAIVVGAPARRVGWAGTAGVPLEKRDGDRWICPSTGMAFWESDGLLQLE
jgi:UDP-2-acetamido-3-amino-2,3-dideoxy-glucuronate N-acetyltransferase